jgi:uncharacterized protein YqeY
MSRKSELKTAMKDAMKAKERGTVEMIRALLSAIQYEEMNKKVDELADDQVLAVIKRERKKLAETKDFAEKDNRTETVEEINTQIAIVDRFLPQQLSKEDLEKIVRDYCASESNANVGGIMKHLKENYTEQYDGKLASEVARTVIAS